MGISDAECQKLLKGTPPTDYEICADGGVRKVTLDELKELHEQFTAANTPSTGG